MSSRRGLPRPPSRVATGRAEDWRPRAACADNPDAMFPRNTAKEIQAAKAVCRRCPVVAECLAATLHAEACLPRREDLWGIAGGLRPHERRRLLERGVTPEQVLAEAARQAAARRARDGRVAA